MSALERSIREIVRGDESDGELDKIVADLIVREAQEKNRLARDGEASISRASSSGSSTRRSLNTRFLNGIVKGVERHNRHLKEDEERSAVTARDRLEERQERKRKGPSTGRMHGWEEYEEVEHNYHRPIASSPNNHSDLSSHTKRDHSKTKHRTHDSRNEERQPYDNADTRIRSGESYRPSEPGSKMDKYFKSDYDPAMDVDTKVSINQDNLVEDEGWERALSLIQERKRQKEERRESRKMERERKRSKRDEKKRRRTSEDDDDEHKSRDERYRSKKHYPTVSTDPVLKKQYTAKGSIREWDKGKN